MGTIGLKIKIGDWSIRYLTDCYTLQYKNSTNNTTYHSSLEEALVKLAKKKVGHYQARKLKELIQELRDTKQAIIEAVGGKDIGGKI